jgi:ubiquinone/menaquinone biosynthesis C-methylase UbiE
MACKRSSVRLRYAPLFSLKIFLVLDEKEINREAVEKLFDDSALIHKNINSVLDPGISETAKHSNIYRDYFTRQYLLKNISPQKNEMIMDFGCGVGRITTVLAPRVKKITGIDLSVQMLEVARRRCKLPNVEFIHLESPALPFPENTYDKIFTHWVLQHASDEDVLLYLKEFKRILKPGGNVLLFEQIKNEDEYSDKNVHVYRSSDHYKHLLEDAGFASINNFPVMRVPSIGMSLWNKKYSYSGIWKRILSMIDNNTIMRKPQFASYYTMAFIASNQH